MPSLKKRFLQKLADFIIGFPWLIITLSVTLAALSAFYSLNNLKLDTNEDNLISAKKTYRQEYQKFLDQFGDSEYFYVVFEVTPENREEAKKALVALTDKIKDRTDYFTKINYREDLSVFESRAFLLLPDEDFKQLSQKLFDWKAPISRIASLNDFEGLLQMTTDTLQAPLKDLQKNADQLKPGFELLQRILDSMDKPEAMKKIMPSSLLQPILGLKYQQDPDGFFLSPSGRLLFLQIMPKKDYSTMAVVEKPLEFLREKMQELRQDYPNLTFGLTGRPILQADEMASTGNDSLWASMASLIFVALLYIFYLKNLTKPLLIMLALVCGISWSTGFITLTLGHLNLLTLVFAIILVGIGVDYGMHFLLRYLKERNKNQGVEIAIRKSLLATGEGIVTGGLATAAAFFAALAADFLGLQELGFVSGCGVLFCLFSQLITFPALLLVAEKYSSQKKKRPDHQTKNAAVNSFGEFKFLDGLLKKPYLTLGLVLCATLAAAPFYLKTHFENNILKLQDPHLESVIFEKKIMEDGGASTWFAASLASSEEELTRLEEALKKLPSVASVESLHSVIPLNQEARRANLNQLKQNLSFNFAPSQRQVLSDYLREKLEKLKLSLENIQNLAFQSGETQAVESMETLMSTTSQLLEKLDKDGDKTWQKIRQSEIIFFSNLHQQTQQFMANLSPAPLTVHDLPQTVRQRYISASGQYALYITPAGDIWQENSMEKFIQELRTVDPHVTGAPVSVYESAKRMKHGFYRVGFLTLILVFIFMMLDFRSWPHAFIASLPLISGFLWLLGWMNFLGVSLNLANFFALPILIGLGIDNGVHLVHHFREHRNVKEMLHTVAPAIILSTLTTLIGFGALSMVRHRGLASFGMIMSIGSLTCLVAALLMVPIVLRIVYKK